MMRVTALLAAATSLRGAWALPAGPDVLETDFLVIGGGSSGTYAAVQLADRGQRVLVIEKSGKMGGHASTYTDPATGGVVNAGVQLLHNTSVVHKYFDRLGVPLAPVTLPTNPITKVDFRTGRAVTNFTDPTPQELQAAFGRYVAYHTTRFPNLEAGYDAIPDPVPADLSMPFVDLARREGFDAILKTLNDFNSPVDALSETALYTLKSFGPSLVALSPIAPRDMMDLYRAAAALLGDRVLLHTTVTGLDRAAEGGGAVVAQIQTLDPATGRATARTVRAKKLVMAAFPLLPNLQGWDLTAEEARLFAKFQPYSYFAGVLRHAGLGGASLSNFSPDRFRGVPALPAVFNVGPTRVPGAYGVYVGAAGVVANDTAVQMVRDAVGRLTAGGVVGQGELKIVGWYEHTPVRLHVGPADIAAGFYKDLYALQGQTNTWWTGAAWETQDSSQIWKFTDRVLDKMLGPEANTRW